MLQPCQRRRKMFELSGKILVNEKDLQESAARHSGASRNPEKLN
jgi:hypothetical protein